MNYWNYWNILTGISLPWQAFLLSSFCNSLNIFFLSINLEENYRLFVSIISLILRIHGCFSYLPLDCTKNWISNGLGYTIPPPTTSQNISTATHEYPPPATIHPPPPTITLNGLPPSNNQNIFIYCTFWHCFNSFFFLRNTIFLWWRFCLVKF